MVKQLKDKRFGMVLTANEQELLKTMALEDGLSESAFIRSLIYKAYKEKDKHESKNQTAKSEN